MSDDIANLLTRIDSYLDGIESDELPSLRGGVTESTSFAEQLQQAWVNFSIFGRMDTHYARCNDACSSCYIAPTELRQDVEIALKPSFVTEALGIYNRDLLSPVTIDFGSGAKITLEPGHEEPGVTTPLPMLSSPQPPCSGTAPDGLGTEELGLQPGLAATVTGNPDAFELRLGTAFTLFALGGSPGTLELQPARGHGICPEDILPAVMVERSYRQIFEALTTAAPKRIPLRQFIPNIPDKFPDFELFAATRNEGLLNIHFLYADRETRALRRLHRLGSESDWSYAIRLEISPLKDLINGELEAYDFETNINDNIPDVGGADVVEVHITRQETGPWLFDTASQSFEFNFDLDYDYVLLGFPVKGTLFGEITVATRQDLPWEAMIAFTSSERIKPTVNAGPIIINLARQFSDKMSSELFSRIGPFIGQRTIFAPGGISLVRPIFGANHLNLEVWI
ncbi:MAG: hypothetical protein KJ725_06270 [Gammaproteobacteria bacterium]|nr:hypothetical protein [Gammaproteobacteria bacterium]